MRFDYRAAARSAIQQPQRRASPTSWARPGSPISRDAFMGRRVVSRRSPAATGRSRRSPPSTACPGPRRIARWSRPPSAGCRSRSRRAGWGSMRPGSGRSAGSSTGSPGDARDPWLTSFVDCSRDGLGSLLGLAPGRTGACVRDWLAEQTPQFRAAIEIVVIDPSAPYASGIRAALPEALIAVDRWHLVALGEPDGDRGSATRHPGAARSARHTADRGVGRRLNDSP